MADKRYVLLNYTASQAAISSSLGYGIQVDAVAAGNTAAPAGGYRVVDSWELGRVVADTTGTFVVAVPQVNQNQAVNVLGTASNLWPV